MLGLLMSQPSVKEWLSGDDSPMVIHENEPVVEAQEDTPEISQEDKLDENLETLSVEKDIKFTMPDVDTKANNFTEQDEHFKTEISPGPDIQVTVPTEEVDQALSRKNQKEFNFEQDMIVQTIE